MEIQQRNGLKQFTVIQYTEQLVLMVRFVVMSGWMNIQIKKIHICT